MPPLYHKYRHLSRGILIKIRKNNQIVKDRCQDFQERAASRQAAVLSASLPHYTLYRLFVKPSCTIIRNYLEVFISCRKSLPAKDLRRRGAAPPVLSRCHQRTYDGRRSGFRSVIMHFNFSILDQSPRTTSSVTPES